MLLIVWRKHCTNALELCFLPMLFHRKSNMQKIVGSKLPYPPRISVYCSPAFPIRSSLFLIRFPPTKLILYRQPFFLTRAGSFKTGSMAAPEGTRGGALQNPCRYSDIFPSGAYFLSRTSLFPPPIFLQTLLPSQNINQN